MQAFGVGTVFRSSAFEHPAIAVPPQIWRDGGCATLPPSVSGMSRPMSPVSEYVAPTSSALQMIPSMLVGASQGSKPSERPTYESPAAGGSLQLEVLAATPEHIAHPGGDVWSGWAAW